MAADVAGRALGGLLLPFQPVDFILKFVDDLCQVFDGARQ